MAADDIIHHKPHPEPLEKALAMVGGTKSEAVMVGDSDKDIEASIHAGTDSIQFFPPDHTKFYELEKLRELDSTYVIIDLRQLLKIVGA